MTMMVITEMTPDTEAAMMMEMKQKKKSIASSKAIVMSDGGGRSTITPMQMLDVSVETDNLKHPRDPNNP